MAVDANNINFLGKDEKDREASERIAAEWKEDVISKEEEEEGRSNRPIVRLPLGTRPEEAVPSSRLSPAMERTQAMTDAFKYFAATAKLRLRSNDRIRSKEQQARDQDVKLQDLKSFAKNFKLTSPVPPDLVSILGKDLESQLKIRGSTKRRDTKGAENLSSEKVQAERRAKLQPASFRDVVIGRQYFTQTSSNMP